MSPLEREGFYVGQLVVLLKDTFRMKAGSIVQITEDLGDITPKVTLVVGKMFVFGSNIGFVSTHKIMPLCTSNLES